MHAPIRDPSRDPHVSGIYREIVEAGLGAEMPISWFRVQSGRPDILEATWKLVKGLLLQGELPGTLKHMLMLQHRLRSRLPLLPRSARERIGGDGSTSRSRRQRNH